MSQYDSYQGGQGGYDQGQQQYSQQQYSQQYDGGGGYPPPQQQQQQPQQWERAKEEWGYAPEEQKVQGRKSIITYDDEDEVIREGKKIFKVSQGEFQRLHAQGAQGKKHYQVAHNFNRTEIALPKGKARVVVAGSEVNGNQSSVMDHISRDHLDGQFQKPANKPKKKTPRPVLYPGEAIRHEPTHNSSEQSFHFSKQGIADTARWRDELPQRASVQQIQAERHRPNVMPGESLSYQPTFNSNISTFQSAISRDHLDGQAAMPYKEVYLNKSKNQRQPNIKPGEALRYQPRTHNHHASPLGHITNADWAKELPNKSGAAPPFQPKFKPARKSHQFSVQLGSDEAEYPKGQYLKDKGMINGKDPKEYTSLRCTFF